MADHNLSRQKSFAEKKMSCWTVLPVTYEDITVIDDVYYMAQLPEQAVITRVIVDVKEAGDAALVFDIGFDGGAELVADVDVVTTGPVVTAVEVATDSGKQLTIVPKTAAGITQGSWVVSVEYLEYNLGLAKFTKYLPDTI